MIIHVFHTTTSKPELLGKVSLVSELFFPTPITEGNCVVAIQFSPEIAYMYLQFAFARSRTLLGTVHIYIYNVGDPGVVLISPAANSRNPPARNK